MKTNVYRRTWGAAAAVLIGLVPAAVAGAQAAPPAVDLPAPPQGAWPKAEQRQGRYFSFVAPVGWNVTESTNGVDILNPNGIQGINFIGLEGTPGSITPVGAVQRLGGWIKLRDLKFTSVVNRPSQGGFDSAELLFTYSDSTGRAFEGWAWSAVNNSYGRNNTYTAIAAATPEIWRRDAQFMVATVRLVAITNPREAFQRDKLISNNVPAGPGSAGGFNRPNTFTPHSNQAAMDRISARGAEVRRDSYSLTDPSTGRAYIGTSANYDYVRGGWVNPNDRTQLLKPVNP